VAFKNPLRQPWDGMTAHTGVFVRYEGKDEQKKDQFLVLAVNCAHLGCPVSWFPQSGLFMCPCHGGVYYANGERASGPPPRGLFRCVWRVREGQLEVQAPHYPTLQDTLESNA
jgi:Rieske Fe-S protein